MHFPLRFRCLTDKYRRHLRAPVKPSAAFGRHFDFRAARFHLRQRGKVVVVLRQIRVVNGAIVLRHGKGGMSKELLERERVSAAVNQIFPCECVAEQVNRSFLHSAPRVVSCDRLPQAVLRELCTRFRAKEVIGAFPASIPLILPQNGDHGAAKGNDLGFPVFCVAVEHHAAVQIHIPNLNCPNRGGTTAAVEQKVDNHPVPIFRKSRFANVGLFQKCSQLRVRIGFLYGFLGLVSGIFRRVSPCSLHQEKKDFRTRV